MARKKAIPHWHVTNLAGLGLRWDPAAKTLTVPNDGEHTQFKLKREAVDALKLAVPGIDARKMFVVKKSSD